MSSSKAAWTQYIKKQLISPNLPKVTHLLRSSWLMMPYSYWNTIGVILGPVIIPHNNFTPIISDLFLVLIVTVLGS